jgi:hypothetical protein
VSALLHFLADLARALRMLPALVWADLADACLTDGRGSVLDGMWLTDGDPTWGYRLADGPWVTGRGPMPRNIAYRPS